MLRSKGASAFELLYNRRPPLHPQLDANLPPPITVQEHVQQMARRRLLKMLRSRIYEPETFEVGDRVAIYRDGPGWLRPARIVEVTPHHVIVDHKDRRKSSGFNRTRLTSPCDEFDEPSNDSTGTIGAGVSTVDNWHENLDEDDDGAEDDYSTDNEVSEINTSISSASEVPLDVPSPTIRSRRLGPLACRCSPTHTSSINMSRTSLLT